MKIKRLIIMCILFIILMMGVTYAFFSYVYIGSDNIVKTGDITFNADYTSVSLNDVFPIKNSEALTDTENVMTVNISITGKTSYEKGVDFKVMAEDVNILSGGKEVPINVMVSSSNLDNIKTINYQEEMVIVNNSVLAQGTIKKGDEVNGTVTIKAYISESNVLISDTYDGSESDNMGTSSVVVSGREVFTTDEWNSLGNENSISFKLKVIANIHEENLYDILVDNATLDNVASEYVASSSGIDFSKISSNTNGRGLYMMSDTKDDSYPIVYYRGNVDNNNVIFGGFCWQIVRTTETGGTKLIYNGKPSNVYEKTILQEDDYNVTSNVGFTYDENSGYWGTTSDSTNGLEISFNVLESDNYIIDILGYVDKGEGKNGTYLITKDSATIFNGTVNRYNWVNLNEEINTLTNGNTVKINLTGAGWDCFYVRLIKKENLIGIGCDNYGSNASIKQAPLSNQKNSIAYSGYMYNKVYVQTIETPVSNAYFANDVIYINGKYQLINSELNYSSNRHYTCNSTNSDATCEVVRYYTSSTNYIELDDGVNITKALKQMTNASDINKIDSDAKKTLETWYYNNLIDYAESIEDTIWCNDRSISNNGAYSINGSGNLVFKTHSRSTINLKCTNETDNFSLSNRNARINYPIGLITADETRLAGAVNWAINMNYYLYAKAYYWAMSPSYFSPYDSSARWFYVTSSGGLSNGVIWLSNGLRPSISLSFGASIKSGNGTKGNPYVIA